ncbi:hypothetical protein CK203_094166 [Vitis vinifera]|uniref:Uncharacterized protein n=1 Tax=Vitis vinifera TaxID=29760 RepID=A0A438C3A7_VITVI|nr:hypothetical protein CK203_094166 [Vitis vinifera]
MVGGKGLVEAEGALSRVSSAHACLMEKASRYSILSPSSFCIWRGQNSSSSPFSGVERPLVKVKEGQERDFEKGDGGSIPKREVGDGVVKEEGKDVESWRYNCLAKFCHCLGMPTKGFEGEILKLLKKMKEKRERFEKGGKMFGVGGYEFKGCSRGGGGEGEGGREGCCGALGQ